jgi:hypothetical protein
VGRFETQMSRPPEPAGRSESKYRLKPSLEIAGAISDDVVLIVGPRFTGADHAV